MAITQYILGIKPTYRGLSVKPVIPGDWAGFEAKRVFRGVVYNIKVEKHSKRGTTSFSVDGQMIEGCIIPIPHQGTREVNVLVELAAK